MNFINYASLTGLGINIPEYRYNYIVSTVDKDFSIHEIRKLAASLDCFLCYTVTREKVVNSVFKFRPVEDYGLLKIIDGTNVDGIYLFTNPDNTREVVRAEVHYTDGQVDLAIPDSFELSELCNV